MKVKLTAQQRQDILEALELAAGQLASEVDEAENDPYGFTILSPAERQRLFARADRYNDLAELFRRS